MRLEKDSMQRYCHETGGEAWSLARGVDDITYLQHEADLLEDAQDAQSPFNFGQGTSAAAGQGASGACATCVSCLQGLLQSDKLTSCCVTRLQLLRARCKQMWTLFFLCNLYEALRGGLQC